MAKTHIPLEDLFLGEEAAQVVEALAESIARAGSDNCRLIIEGRAEPDETRRSRQEFTVELDPGSDPPPHAESVLAELQRNYEEALSPGFTGTVRLNFKGKGQGTTYRSIQRKAFIEGPDEDEIEEEDYMEDEELPPSRYGGPPAPPRGRLFRPHSSRSPRLDLSREDEDESYFDGHSPPGTISPGRVRGLSPGQGEYIFLPHFEAVINVGERRNDRITKALMAQQELMTEVTKGLLDNQRELNEQLLGMIGTKSVRAQQAVDKPQDGKMASWLGSMLVNGVMKQMKQGGGGSGGPSGSGQRSAPAPPRASVPAGPTDSAEYDPYENPTFTVPSAHSSEFAGEEDWEEEEFQAPMHRPESSPASRGGSNGPMSGNEIMDAIRDLREREPEAFKETIQERGEELIGPVMEAMGE
jgi:hypothetical protein